VTPLRLARWGVKLALLGASLLVVYVALTFAQVWWASRQDSAPPSDAIVVLGAAQWDGKPSPVLQARLDHAVDLWERGVAPVIVVTGGNQPGDRFTQGFTGYDELKHQGVPEDAIRVEIEGHDTYTELSASAHILRSEELGERVVLVSDPYHAFRSQLIAEEVGLDASVSPTDSDAPLESLARETAAVSLGRIIGFRRLSNWT
jgi:uncharacterized SAM-binding protein YcdF (DUF218 family)